MGDVCTDTPTRTIFATSTSQGSAVVSTSTSQSLSVGPGSVVTRSVQSGTGWIVSESSVAGSTETVQVEVPITISGGQQVFTVPISTLFAPCTSSTPTSTSTSTSTSTTPTSTSTSTSTTPTSTPPETTETPESQTSSTERTSRSPSPTPSPQNTNANANTSPTPTPPAASPTPTPTPTPQGGNSVSQTGTLTTFSTFSTTTLPNGDHSTVVILSTSSIAPSGGLNGNDTSGNSGGSSNSNSGRAVAIGVGVAGGVIALIILIFGITWHIRHKRRNALPLDDSDIWGPHHEAKTPPQAGLTANNLGPGYTYNPYSEGRAAAYAPVPTMSPPRARPTVLAELDENRLSAASYGSQPASAAGLTAPLLSRAKTADQILYEAAREDLPRSRASSATASHHTRPSETGVSHRPHPSLTASHKTHGSLASRTSGSATGLLDHPPPSSAHSSLQHDAQAAQRFVGASAELERPTSPVSIAAPRLAIVNPDV